ncbi:MAG: sigma-54 dependent transcriptional regulator [Elusimicrobia bacterium]|nr:sigma-54 dependent transcriptional regulator [Candidatus Obscuribacterium magneticum]
MPAIPRLLILDDEEHFADELAGTLAKWNYEVFRARHRQAAVPILTEMEILVVLLGMNQSKEETMEDLRWIKTRYPHIEVIILAQRGHFGAAFKAMSLRAYDFLIKSPNMEELASVIDQAYCRAGGHVRKKLMAAPVPPRPMTRGIAMVGRSPEISKVLSFITKIAPADSNVLITGETGVGKELAARLIHQHSRRAGGPFVPVNCGAIPESLLENELFGHAKGAFTDSIQVKPGLLEEAEGGTLFLDEISEMGPAPQAKLLRVLETRTFRRLGDTKERMVDIRIVTAANRDLEAEIKANRFRADLYYRLAVILVDIPALRKRREDIPLLVEHFLKYFTALHGISEKKPSPSAMQILLEYDWPGNVRETKNVMERLAILCENNVITPADVFNLGNIKGIEKLEGLARGSNITPPTKGGCGAGPGRPPEPAMGNVGGGTLINADDL